MRRSKKIDKHVLLGLESGKLLFSQQIYHNHGYAGLRTSRLFRIHVQIHAHYWQCNQSYFYWFDDLLHCLLDCSDVQKPRKEALIFSSHIEFKPCFSGFFLFMKSN